MVFTHMSHVIRRQFFPFARQAVDSGQPSRATSRQSTERPQCVSPTLMKSVDFGSVNTRLRCSASRVRSWPGDPSGLWFSPLWAGGNYTDSQRHAGGCRLCISLRSKPAPLFPDPRTTGNYSLCPCPSSLKWIYSYCLHWKFLWQ